MTDFNALMLFRPFALENAEHLSSLVNTVDNLQLTQYYVELVDMKICYVHST